MNTVISRNKNKIQKILSITQKIGIIIGLILLIQQIHTAFNSIYTDYFSLKLILNISKSIVFASIAIFFQILAWKSVMSIVEAEISTKSAVRGYVLSFIPKYIPGTIWGYLSRSEWLKEEFSIEYHNSNFGSIYEIATIFFSSFVIISIYFSLNIAIYILLVPLLCFVGWILFLPLLESILVRNKMKFISSLFHQHAKFRLWFSSLFYGTMMWVFNGLALYLLIINFNNFHTSLFRELIFSTFAFCVAWLMGFIVLFVPSGLGIRESILAVVVSNLFEINPGQSAFIAILFRLVILTSEGLFLLLGLRFLKWKKLFKNLTFNKK